MEGTADASAAPSALGMSTVHRRLDPAVQEAQQAKRKRILNSNIEEDNKKRLHDLIGYRSNDQVRQVRRIDCSAMSKVPKETFPPNEPEKTEPAEKVPPPATSDDTRSYDRQPTFDDSRSYDRQPTYDDSRSYDRQPTYDDSRSYDRKRKFDESRSYDGGRSYEREIDDGFVVRDHRISSKIQRVRTKRREPPKKEDEWEPQNEIEVAVRDLLKYDQLPSPEMQPEIIEHVKYESAQAVLNKDYDRAAQLEAVYHLVNDGLEWQQNEMMRLEAKEALEERINEARGRLEEEQQKWERILSEFYEQQKAEREEMLAGQEEEMTEFEDKWADETKMIKYSKPTPELIALRKTEKYMAMLKEFEGAKIMCQRADALQEDLTAEAENRAILDMVQQHGTLLEKHKREVECFDEHERRIEQYLKLERDKAILPIEKQIEQLQNKKNQDAPTNMKPATTQAYIATTRTRTCRTARAIPARTEETTRAIAEFRNRQEIPKLAVRALDVRRIIGKSTSNNGATRVVSVLRGTRRLVR